MEPIKNRYDFVMYFDVENGNPNGDPDADNMPRMDAETAKGLVTAESLKRKVRNYVEAVKEGVPGYRIYVKSGIPLARVENEAFKYLGVDPAKAKEAKKKNDALDRELEQFMCQNFYDIRTFGAVMTTLKKGGLNGGQVRGPVQMGMATSVDPIMPKEIVITRSTITNEADLEKGQMIASKYIVPYALYRVEGYVSANLAKKTTGFTEEDLELFWNALINMFDLDHSAARGNMATRKLIIFKHDSEFGNTQAYRLFDLVKAEKKPNVVIERSYNDYTVSVDLANVPDGVTCIVRE